MDVWALPQTIWQNSLSVCPDLHVKHFLCLSQILCHCHRPFALQSIYKRHAFAHGLVIENSFLAPAFNQYCTRKIFQTVFQYFFSGHFCFLVFAIFTSISEYYSGYIHVKILDKFFSIPCGRKFYSSILKIGWENFILHPIAYKKFIYIR